MSTTQVTYHAKGVSFTDTGAKKVREFLDGTLALKLAQHQHRPVLAVPLTVVDWKAPMPWG